MSKEISRREFFKIAGGIAAGASFSSLTTSCASTPTLEKPTSQLTRSVISETTSSEPTFSPTETPTVTPIPKPTNTLIPKPTFTPEQTPTAEVVVFPQTQITAELLKQGFANVGGAEETIDLSKITTPNAKEAQTLSWKTIEGYASLAWDEKISLEDLAKDEIKATKAVVSLGSQAGVEGFYRPGEVLPQFKDLTLLRLAIDKLPGSQDFYDAKLSSFPQNLIIRKGSHLTVLGLWADESGRWATVATDEGFDREKSGIQPRDIPRQYLAVIPQDLPDNIEGLSLQRLLNANNYNYSNGVVENLGDTGKLYHQELNIIEPTLAKNLEKEAGALFMDQKPDGSWYENPIVPYPAKEITGDTYGGVTVTKDGQVVAMSSDGTKEIAKAKYDSEKRQWVWEAVVVATPTPEATPTQEKPKKPELVITPQYSETHTDGKIIVTLLSDESLPDEARVGIKPGRENDLLSFLEEKFVSPFRDQGKQFWAVTETGGVLPEPVTIDWSKPIELAWKRGTQGRIIGGGGAYVSDSTTFEKREDGGLRVIFYYPPTYFTEDGKFSPDQGPPKMFEAGFAFDIAKLAFLVSQEKFMQGKQGYTPDEFKAWFASQPDNDYDHRIISRHSLEDLISTSLTTYK